MREQGQSLPYFSGSGDTSLRLRVHDWASSPLGHPGDWPAELRTVVALVLDAPYPAAVAWSAALSLICNDAWSATLGEAAPCAPAAPLVLDWPALVPLAAAVLEGHQPAPLHMPVSLPDGAATRQHWVRVSGAPVRGADGAILGVFLTGADTGARAVEGGETQARRMAFQRELSVRLRHGSSPDDIVATAAAMLGQELGATRVAYAEVEGLPGSFYVRRDWTADDVPVIAGMTGRLEDFGLVLLEALREGRAVTVDDLMLDPRTSAHAATYAALGAGALLAVPLQRGGQLATVLCVHAAGARHWREQDVWMARDVAERTWLAIDALRAESALHESEARLQAVFDSLPVGVGVADAAGTMVLANREMQRYLPTGIMPSRDDRRFPRWRLFHPDGRLVERGDYPGARALRGERVVPGIDALYRQDDGSEIWTQVGAVPIRDAAGRITGQVSVVTDIDQAKRTETALYRSEERYRKLFNQMDAGFCIVQVVFDEAGRPCDLRYLEANPRFESQTGLKDPVGRTIRELVPDLEDEWIELTAAVALGGDALHVEKRSAALGRWFDINAFAIGDPLARHVAIVFRDTTERHRIEDDIRRLAAEASESSRRKSEFLAVLAHELRNPMAPIRTGLEIMRMRADNPAMMDKVRDMLERQTRQMTHLIDDLLDIARITSGKIEIRKQHIDLNWIVSNAVETSMPVIQKGGHALSLARHDGPLLLHADPTRIAQVIANLLTNAAKYTPAGGSIRLDVAREGETACVTVTDNGVGIPAEALDAIFGMFNQVGRHIGLAQGGLGIGLSLVQQLVDLHGGSVAAASAGTGQGSTFTVRLPLGHAATDEVAHGAPASEAAAGRAFRVLIVDDNVDAAESLALLLEIHRHQIRTAANAREALGIAHAFQPQVVFLDIGMPGMNGFELARALRSIPGLAAITIAAVTGWGTEEDIALSRQAGIDHHFTKPIAAEALARVFDGIA